MNQSPFIGMLMSQDYFQFYDTFYKKHNRGSYIKSKYHLLRGEEMKRNQI